MTSFLQGKNVREVFNIYLNTCPHQGSRTIRAEVSFLMSCVYFVCVMGLDYCMFRDE